MKKLPVKPEAEMTYGQELILDIHGCDTTNMTYRGIKNYLDELCKEIDMVKCGLHFWEEEFIPKEEWENCPHLRGISAVQFIKTSSITVHAIYGLKRFYVDIFSCKKFDRKIARKVTLRHFKGKIKTDKCFVRK
jgi:S-adenosylmethionine/arginine decarboxylase-like enzyme